MSINQTVIELLETKPFIKDTFKQDIVNYSGLARNLTPIIKARLGKKKVNFEAVIMAVKRYAETVKGDLVSGKVMLSLSKCDLRLKGNIVNLVLNKTERNYELALSAYKKIDWQRGDIIHVYQSLTEIAVLVDKSNKSLFSKGSPVHIERDLAMVTLKTPKEAVDVPGFIYYILGLVASEGIILIDVISTYTELNLVVREKDGAKVYNLIFEAIKKSKKLEV